MKIINEGVEKEGLFYLFAARMTPVVPFSAINLCSGLTNLKVLPYAIVSQVGMIPEQWFLFTLGRHLAKLNPLEAYFHRK